MSKSWTTRPEKPVEIDPREITERIFEDGELIHCSQCGKVLEIRHNPRLIRRCENCPEKDFKNKIAAYRIIGKKIYLDIFFGKYQKGKSLSPVTISRIERGVKHV